MQNRASILIQESGALLGALDDAETGQRGFLLTGSTRYLEPYVRGETEAADALARLTSLLQRRGQLAELRGIRRLMAEKFDELSTTVQLERSGRHESALSIVRTNAGKETMDELRQRIARLIAECDASRTTALRDETFRIGVTGAAFGGLCLAVIALLVFALVMQKKAFTGVARGAERMARAAFRDPLTGLPNRRDLERRLNQHQAGDDGDNARATVLFIDLDGFKTINDSLGHAAGDALLRRISTTLRRVLRPGDFLARVGGDEFVLLTSTLDCEEASLLCRRLIAAVGTRVKEYGSVGLSIGIATHETRSEPLAELLARADRAMYDAKRSGGGYRFSEGRRELPRRRLVVADGAAVSRNDSNGHEQLQTGADQHNTQQDPNLTSR